MFLTGQNNGDKEKRTIYARHIVMLHVGRNAFTHACVCMYVCSNRALHLPVQLNPSPW